VIVEPPFDAGAVKGTFICKSPRVGVPTVGAPAATAVIAAVGEDKADPFGAIPLIAVTSTRMNVPTKLMAFAMKLDCVAPAMSVHAVAVSVAEVQLFHW
jgi:hypothetical protein